MKRMIASRVNRRRLLKLAHARACEGDHAAISELARLTRGNHNTVNRCICGRPTKGERCSMHLKHRVSMRPKLPRPIARPGLRARTYFAQRKANVAILAGML